MVDEPAQPPAEPPAENQDEKNPIEEAKKVLAKISEQNVIMAENLKKAEKLQAEMIMTGRGRSVPQQTQEDKEVDEARNLLKGSGYDDELFPRKQVQV